MKTINSKTIRKSDYWIYGGLALSNTLAAYMLSSYLLSYYTDVALVSAGAVGLVVLIMRFTDGISDLLMGQVIDHSNLKMGKAKPWILIGSIGVAAMLIAVFRVPGSLTMGGKIAWLAGTYFLINTVFATMQGVSQYSILVYMTDDPKNRGKLGACNMAGIYIGGLTASALTIVLLSVFGANQSGYNIIVLAYSAIVLVLGVLAALRLREQNRPSQTAEESASLKQVLYCVFHNKYYLPMIGACLLINLINGITSGLGVYFSRDLFGSASLYSVVALVLVVPTLIGLPFAVKLVGKLGYHKVLVWGRIAYMLGTLGEAVGLYMGNFIVFIIFVGFCGFTAATFAACVNGRVADICDYNEWKFKIQASGSLMSAKSFCEKVGGGLGAAIAGIVLEIAQYSGELASAGLPQSVYTVSVERAAVALLPIVLNIFGTVLLYKSNVDPEMDAVRRELAERKEAEFN